MEGHKGERMGVKCEKAEGDGEEGAEEEWREKVCAYTCLCV